MLFLTLGDW